MKEIRIFSNLNKLQLSQEVNDFICNNKIKIHSLQYDTTTINFITKSVQYSVMVVFEKNDSTV
ncbi:hypothetical protein KQI30_03640 [Clostridium bornimense]|uniref:hypothetical protein n=1 Tax=Clostridium bornimense TaxID=1216932 RepID=UPI001C11F562|nr:hypothetical protein [Clostridium bornimense]MBU5315372.1 hypothetical protein [Clostridium bornimense]